MSSTGNPNEAAESPNRSGELESPAAPAMEYGPVQLQQLRGETANVTSVPTVWFAALAALGFVGLSVVAYVTLRYWPSTSRTAMFAVAGTVFPMVIALVLMPRRGWVRGMVISFVVWGVAFAGVAAWSQTSVRASLVSAAARTPEAMRHVLQDDLEVALAGCVEYGGLLPDPDWIGPYIAELEVRPELVGDCMRAIHPTAATLVIESLDRRWMPALYETATASSCDIAKTLPSLPVEPTWAASRLVSCAATGPAGAQPCCADALRAMVPTREAWADTLRALPGNLRDEKTTVALYDTLLNADGDSVLRDRYVKEVNGRGVREQTIALTMVCDQLDLGSQVELLRFLHVSVEGRCSIDTSRLNYDTEIWSHACRATERAMRSDASRPVLEVMCEQTNAGLVARALEVAQSIVRPAAHRQLQHDLADSILEGYHDHLVTGTNLSVAELEQREQYMSSRKREETDRTMFRDPNVKAGPPIPGWNPKPVQFTD